jgi:hypothetical protein
MPGNGAPQQSQSGHRSPKFKILSLDGGGIYGLVTAMWLRKLAEQQPEFLAEPTRKPGHEPPSPKNDLSVIAGASSGAVNALLLAKYDRPRDALLSGEIEGFWKRAGVFSNTDPVTSWSSYWGIGAWFGTQDLKRVFEDYFGSMKLWELKHNVLISCFDWNGHDRSEFIDFNDSPAGGSGFPWPRSGESMGWERFFPHQGTFRPYPGALPGNRKGHSWRPRTFTNFLPFGNPKDWDYRVADLAYAACAAPGFRAVIGGIADAASATVNPAVDAIAGITYLVRWYLKDQSSKRKQSVGVPELNSPIRSKSVSTVEAVGTEQSSDEPFVYQSSDIIGGTHFHSRDDELRAETLRTVEELFALGILDQMGVLSLGDGTLEPSYWLENFNLSTAQLMMFPTNPLMWNVYPPSTWLALDAPTQNIDDYARALIGPNRYVRVDPKLLPIPTLVASGIARFPWYRSWLTDQLIPSAASSSASTEAVDWAVRFLKQQWWLDDAEARAAM